MEKTGIIILAAGTSSRLGKQKQLLKYNGQSLLQRQVSIAVESGAKPVIVVLGADAEVLSKEIKSSVEVVVNLDYQKGMSTSIRCGIDIILKIAPSVESVIIMVCDQPFTSTALLKNIVAAHKDSGKPIIACSYADTFGPPTLFHKNMFTQLQQLTGDVGARKVVQQHLNETQMLSFPEGEIDIDTEEDYNKLLQRN